MLQFKKIIIFFISVLIWIFSVQHSFALNYNIPMRGEYRFTYWGFDVYIAQLYMESTCVYPQCDLKLRLIYQDNFDKNDIVNVSIDEMHQQKYISKNILSERQKILNDIFVNVKKNDVIDGIMINNQAKFYHNGRFIGKIIDKNFVHDFFGIWLFENTNNSKMREALLK